MIGDDVVLLPALEVAHTRLPIERVILKVDDACVAMGHGIVVIEGRKLGDGGAEVRLPNPPVKIDDFGFVFLDQFCIACEPVTCPGGAYPGPVVDQTMIVAASLEPLVGGSVE